MWTARMVLEASQHENNCFFTITYDQAHLPRVGTLVPMHLKLFRYQLRNLYGSYRYYFVGEYGSDNFRPHYHGMLFGLSLTQAQIARAWQDENGVCRCDPIRGIHVGFSEIDSAAYVAGYVTKKMTSANDPRLEGRHPEFARMSNRPGLGFPGLYGIYEWLHTYEGCQYLTRYFDVPKTIRFHGKIYPLGRYLVSALRTAMDIPLTRDPRRDLMRELQRQENLSPPAIEAREFKRTNSARKAEFYAKLRVAMEKL